MVIGLLVMAAGAAGFLPAAYFAKFPIFLAALIVLAAGMTTVQVAVNPYVTIIGPPATASSRLNLAQAFNSVGTFIAPFFGSILILRGAKPLAPQTLRTMNEAAQQLYRTTEAASVRLPYIGITLALVLLAIALGLVKLKTHTTASEVTQDFRPGAYADSLGEQQTIWNKPWLLFGALGIFTYVGAEVAIGSLLVNYMGLPQIAGMREEAAARYLMFYWGGAMLGRFIGSAVLQRVRTGPVLGAAGVCAMLLTLLSVATHGHTAMWALLAVGPVQLDYVSIDLHAGDSGAGAADEQGVESDDRGDCGRGADPAAYGRGGGQQGIADGFLIPAVCYVYIASYGFMSVRRPAPSNVLVPVEPV